MCMHCQDPACASACLVGALKKTAAGPVTYDGAKCIGCRYCLVACPFSVPRYEWSKLVPYVKKCDMCAGRQAKGQQPACVEACPVQASIAGESRGNSGRGAAPDPGRPEIREAHLRQRRGSVGRRCSSSPTYRFEKLGFVAAPKQPMPVLTANALGDGPTVILVGGALLSGLYWITRTPGPGSLGRGPGEICKGKGLSYDTQERTATGKTAAGMTATNVTAMEKTTSSIFQNHFLAHRSWR